MISFRFLIDYAESSVIHKRIRFEFYLKNKDAGNEKNYNELVSYEKS